MQPAHEIKTIAEQAALIKNQNEKAVFTENQNDKQKDAARPCDKNNGISLRNMEQEHTHVCDCDACKRGDWCGMVVRRVTCDV